MRTRTYYCDCGEHVESVKGEIPQCSCGEVFGRTGSHLDGINMRTTWSGTTKIEFNTTTMDESIKKMNNG